ncbi:MAG: porin [Pseudomonadota bacterium]
MKIKLLGTALALAVAAAPIAAVAGGVSGGNANSNWTIYGWQNWSYEFVDFDDGTEDRKTQRINNNAANIGFAASLDTGLDMGGEHVKVNFQCEQFTFFNRFNGFSDFCNRNSKISLSGVFGEIMFAQWLLPFNEMFAGWIDPFYDAGADSHTSIMGNVGGGQAFFYNGSFGPSQAFNRRQEEIVQYFSPNFNGFTFRVATTNAATTASAGNGDNVVTTATGTDKLDPRIWSTALAYENTLASGGNLWFAAGLEIHDEWAAVQNGCDDSDDKAYRLAGRYIHQWGNGMSTWISGMWEALEYDWEGCVAIPITAVADGGPDIDVERDAWMISGKQTFGNGFDFRFSYMNGDDLDCSVSDGCTTDSSTGGKAWNLGAFYTMPAGTELRVTYSQVDNDSNAQYDFGIGGVGTGVGEDIDMIALGIVQWF